VRLRARLDKYYLSEGHRDPLIIELPKGGYKPLFREPRAMPANGERRSRIAAAVTALALVAAVAGATWWWRSSPPQNLTVAVLPFDNLSQDPASAYVADGLTDDIIRDLSLIEGLTVPSRTSSFALRGTMLSAIEAGAQLRADYLLEGSVLHASETLKVNVALIRVRDDARMWSGRYDRELTDVFSIHGEISRGIVDTLRLRTGPDRRRYEANVESYGLYLKGRQIMSSFPSQSRPIARLAMEYFEAAIARDASYAIAYAGMADTYLAIERNMGASSPVGADAIPRARVAAERALQIDPLLSEAHSALASMRAREYAWAEAERGFRRAIELNPNNALAHLDLGFPVLILQGRLEEGLDEVRRAVELDPLSPYVNTEFGRALFWAGRYDEAIDQLRIAIALEPSRARPYGALARALAGRGRISDTVTVFEDAVRRGALLSWLANAELACVAQLAGRPDDVLKMMERIMSNPVAHKVAWTYACLGDSDRALDYLEQAVAAREANVAEILRAPDLAWMRHEPRFAILVRKLNLP
jgi:TolB-like protein/tetratricopeptide (TPR) repeat protein